MLRFMDACDENGTARPETGEAGQVDDLYALLVKGSMESDRRVRRE
jgi:hypothetical protein